MEDQLVGFLEEHHRGGDHRNDGQVFPDAGQTGLVTAKIALAKTALEIDLFFIQD